MKNIATRILPAILMFVIFVVSGCGGGGTSGIPTLRLLPEHYPDLPRQQPLYAAQAPIVKLEGSLHIGADVAPLASELSVAVEHNGIDVSYGSVQDGQAASEIIEFLNQVIGVQNISVQIDTEYTEYHPRLVTFADQPTLRFSQGTSDEYIDYTVRAVQLINSTLPNDKRILISSNFAPALTSVNNVPNREIFIEFTPWEDLNDPHKLANTDEVAGYSTTTPLFEFNIDTYELEFKGTRASQIWIDSEKISSSYWVSKDERVIGIIIHELLHSLGMSGNHADSVRFPNSIMHARQSNTVPKHAIFPIDRESLLVMYSALQPGDPHDALSHETLGMWEDTSLHIRGEFDIPGGEVAFGVALRNNLAQPWVYGPEPWTNLVDDPQLSGTTVSWIGRLLGFSLAEEVVGGAAEMEVNLRTLTGQLDFTELEFWAVNRSPGMTGTGTIWGDGDLRYTINVRGNTFHQSGGDEGTVTGAFFGASHEAMGGVLERTDLTAGFGGTR